MLHHKNNSWAHQNLKECRPKGLFHVLITLKGITPRTSFKFFLSISIEFYSVTIFRRHTTLLIQLIIYICDTAICCCCYAFRRCKEWNEIFNNGIYSVCCFILYFFLLFLYSRNCGACHKAVEIKMRRKEKKFAAVQKKEEEWKEFTLCKIY